MPAYINDYMPHTAPGTGDRVSDHRTMSHVGTVAEVWSDAALETSHNPDGGAALVYWDTGASGVFATDTLVRIGHRASVKTLSEIGAAIGAQDAL